MMKLFSKLGLALSIALLAVSTANAAAPVQISFFDLKAPREADINGVRFPAIYGKGGGAIQGVDLQLLAYSEMSSLKGVAIPLIAGIGANHITGDMTGASIGLLNWHEGKDIGANWGVVNISNTVTGAEIGVVNVSKNSDFQLAFVNVTDEIDGVQIGLVNCAKNGFLRCFIFVNFAKR